MFFERIKLLRKENKETQKKIANILDVNQSAYSKWESGKQTIPLEKLFVLSKYYKQSIDFLLGISDKPEISNILYLNKKIIGKNIKNFRKKNNMTQIQLKTFLLTTQSTISAYESGKTLILTNYIFKIAKYFNISIESLLK